MYFAASFLCFSVSFGSNERAEVLLMEAFIV